ncbi:MULTISPECIES: hypothetical protein [Metabacillus]|uniref:Uncharacterized protein n=3 Tax=Metabacillus TaxID=2675233 RepID=A0A179SQ31_9BACI|nr:MULTISPECIES: hypothetical protein [Metabacillus]OAS83876.1 hypothetical protein A6K24_07135 [Metabacillus litoralis]QNF28410.1 hypothetical protein HUW50_13560 [Metabacillus sp. KUDC1714]
MENKGQFEKKEEHVNNEKDVNSPHIDRFSEFMFGAKASSREKKENNHQQGDSVHDENKTAEVNYFTLMEQIDDIMSSLENLKPMLKQFSPIMDYIKKKI